MIEKKIGKFILRVENVDRKMERFLKKLKASKIDGYDIVELCMLRVTINFLETDGLKLLQDILENEKARNRQQKVNTIQNKMKELFLLQGAREELIEQAKMSSF